MAASPHALDSNNASIPTTGQILSRGTNRSNVDKLLAELLSQSRNAAVRQQAKEHLRTVFHSLDEQVQIRTAELRQEIADRRRAENGLRQLTGKLLSIRDDEQRRIARELHDSAGQLLTAAIMDISILDQETAKLSAKGAEALSEIAHLLRETLREIRTTSYLLHPPLLDELGLAPAVGWFAEGFTERSKIKVDLELSTEWPRLSPELETAIFRIIQECLTNIHRHSGSETAKIHLIHCPPQVRVEIEDQGHGIGTDKLAEFRTQTSTGVGMRGMRERIRQLAGTMEVRSNECGTAVLALFPLAAEGNHNSIMQ